MDRQPNRAGACGLQPFLAACVLTGALLLPHAPLGPLLLGMLLAAVVRWGLSRDRGA